MSALIVLLSSDDEAIIGIDWDDVLGTAALVSVTHIVPLPLMKMSESTDISARLSQVKVSGAVHGGLYKISADAILDSGEKLSRAFPVRCFNS